MEQKQRIIFDLPEDATPVQTIIKIMEKNNVPDANDFTHVKIEDSKFIAIYDCSKNLFDKKITDDGASKLLQEKLKITKDISSQIIKDVKEKLIPFAKKVTIGTEPQKKTITAEPVRLINETIPDLKEKITPEPVFQKKEKILPEKTKNIRSKVSDAYREPIE